MALLLPRPEARGCRPRGAHRQVERRPGGGLRDHLPRGTPDRPQLVGRRPDSGRHDPGRLQELKAGRVPFRPEAYAGERPGRCDQHGRWPIAIERSLHSFLRPMSRSLTLAVQEHGWRRLGRVRLPPSRRLASARSMDGRGHAAVPGVARAPGGRATPLCRAPKHIGQAPDIQAVEKLREAQRP